MKISYHDFSKKTGIRSAFHASFNQIYTVGKPDCSNDFGTITHEQDDEIAPVIKQLNHDVDD